MPYIKPEDRHPLEHDQDVHPMDAGQLNFCITRMVHHYLEMRGVRYATLNEVIGVLECAKLELYRRVVTPYEDVKIKDNGDVLPKVDNPVLKGLPNAVHPATPTATETAVSFDSAGYPHRERNGITRFVGGTPACPACREGSNQQTG